MKLQADPTVQYIIKDGPRRLLNKDLKINAKHNKSNAFGSIEWNQNDPTLVEFNDISIDNEILHDGKNNYCGILNVGVGLDISIKELAKMISISRTIKMN